MAPPLTNRTWRQAMLPRGIDEEHRAATPLELFFDLCFVVAVAQAARSLHHQLADGNVGDALGGYPVVFFAIWWAWMNFTWFASAYDNDDVLYRLAVLVQIAGVLILAAGVPRAMTDDDMGVVTLGYAVMRVALAAQWLRAARDDPERRTTDVRYAVGVSVCMVGWAVRLALPDPWRTVGLFVMIVAELSVPVWAERPIATTWHPGHIVERYGLFTLIVLGESVLAATVAVQTSLDAGEALGDLAGIAVGGLLIVFAMWWVYFVQPAERIMEHARVNFGVRSWRESFIWGYGHYVVFGAAAAVGAGLAVAVDQATHHAEISSRAATLAVGVPVALYLVSVWALHSARRGGGRAALMPVTAILVILAAVAGLPVIVLGALMAVLVALKVVEGAIT